MFQYAAGLTLARDLGVPFATARNADLHRVFRTTAARLTRPPTPIRGFIERRTPVYEGPEKRQHGFDPGLAEQRPPIDLRRYFQSERHFAHRADEIAAEFRPRPRHQKTAADRFERVQRGRPPVAAVHVRRTDYLTNTRFNALSTAYVAACVARFPKDAPVLVVSDDAAWCRRTFTAERFCFFETEAEHPAHDLLALSLASRLAVANSSFSWWAAWLGERAGRTRQVLVPDPPFKGFASVDYYPARWERVPGAWWEPGPSVLDDAALRAMPEPAQEETAEEPGGSPIPFGG